jgi:hypothetical protein
MLAVSSGSSRAAARAASARAAAQQEVQGGLARARCARLSLPYMGAGHGAHAKNALATALAMRPLWLMGLRGLGGRAGAGWVGPTGSAQTGRIGFLFFEFISNAKTNSRKV